MLPVSSRRGAAVWCRHACLVAPVVCFAALAAFAAAASAPAARPLAVAYVALAAAVAGTLGLAASPLLLGVVLRALRGGAPDPGLVRAPPTGRARTAVLVPVHQEDPVAVFAAVAALRGSLPEAVGAVDCWVLSDTRDPGIAAAEERAHAALLARIGMLEGAGAGRLPGRAVHYRRRADNTRRKAGNVEEFVARWGGAYDLMVVLDADSLVTGDAVARLVGLMEANPRAGIVQGMCYPIGRDTLFARSQQFAHRLGGPAVARGVAFWQGPRGSWWGHNAIIRVDAFARHCGLPTLPGSGPLGGEILSHDTVEAALMVRAGYEVWLAPDDAVSYEATPTNLVDHLARERRWLRGNLQHIAVLGADGLRPASLLHLCNGILYYLSTPLLLAFLLVAAVAFREGGGGPWAAVLGCLMAALYLGPTGAALGLALAAPAERRGFGGTARLVGGTLLERLIDLLATPVAMACHVAFLLDALLGREVRWDAQERGDRRVGWGEAARRLGRPLLGGTAFLAALAGSGAPWPLWAPFLPGLLLGVPLAVLTSRRPRRAKLLATPEEISPLPGLTALHHAFDAAAAELAAAEGFGFAPGPALPIEQRLTVPRQALRARAPATPPDAITESP